MHYALLTLPPREGRKGKRRVIEYLYLILMPDIGSVAYILWMDDPQGHPRAVRFIPCPLAMPEPRLRRGLCA